MTQEMVISALIGAAVGIIITIIRALRKKDEIVPDVVKSREMKDLISIVMDFTSKEDYARTLARVQEEALLRLKFICGHQGVQVNVKYRPISEYIDVPYLDIPSLDIIKSLGFMKEYLPEIEEIEKIYEENDPVKYLLPITRKFRKIHEKMMTFCTSIWDRKSYEEKKDIIQRVSDQYDLDLINKEGQENSTQEN